MVASGLSLLALAVMGVTAYGLGRPLLVRAEICRDDPWEETVWSLALGLVLAGLVGGALGLAGLLYRPLVVVLTGAGFCWGLTEVAQAWFWHEFRRLEPREPEWFTPAQRPPEPPRWLGWVAGLLAASAVAGSLLSGLAPPTAGDALCYHLELPKRFLQQHALVFSADQENGTYPLLVELWFLWGLALEGPVAAQLVTWGLGLLWALATVVLATPVLTRPWAWLAGVLVLAVPGATNQMTAPLNDGALALFCTLAWLGWQQGLRTRRPVWFALAGAMLGAAWGIKYPALVFTLAAAGVSGGLWLTHRVSGRLLVRGAALSLAVAGLVGGGWYIRALWHRGNPVYPFGSTTAAASAGHAPANKRPLAFRVEHLVAAPWLVTMRPEEFGGRGHQLGPWPLVCLPALALCRRLRGLGALLALAGLYTLAWYALRQNVRFLLPVVPCLAVAAVWLVVELRRFPRLPRALLAGALSLAVGLGFLAPLRRSVDSAAVALGWESREAYLRRTEPTFAAAQLANQLLPGAGQMRLLSQDYRGFYFDCPVTREVIYRGQTHYDQAVRDAGQLARRLRHDGFTHLLVAASEGPRGIRYDDTLSRLVDTPPAASPPAASPLGGSPSAASPRDGDEARPFLTLADYHFADRDGARRHYRLLMLR